MIDILAKLRAARRDVEMADDRAFTNGSMARYDAEIAKFSVMEPAEQLLCWQIRNGKLTAEEQRDGLEVGMLAKIYDPSNPRRPWNFGKIVRKFQPNNTGITIEDQNGILWSAPYGDRVVMVGFINNSSWPAKTENVVPRGLSCGDLFAPIN